jgi:quercetin dioxygenase-like cupin family protein
MYFYDPEERDKKKTYDGVHARTFWGEKLLFSLVDLQAHAIIPSHLHPHEQATFVVKGVVEVTIGNETKWVKQGELFIVPGNTAHSLRADVEPVQILGAFTPVREDLKD